MMQRSSLRCLALWMAVMCGAARVVSAQSAYDVSARTTVVANVMTTAGQPSPRKVTLSVKDSTIAYVVNELTRQAHVQVSYNDASPLFAKRIRVHVVKVDVMDALATALHGTGLVAKLAPDGETVVIRAQNEGVPAERSQGGGGRVSGVVTDSATGNPIGGAKVSIHGMTVTTTTSDQGAFVMTTVPTGDQALEIRAFGYKPLTRMVTVDEVEPRSLRLVMTPVVTMLSGVVTTATGQQAKMAVGSDITTINVDSVMKTAPISTVTDLLENRVPGLTVVHTSGTPGDPSRLLLRGAASINGSNNPIVVVDGVRVYDPQNLGSVQSQIGQTNAITVSSLARPSPLDQIDPNTIATIEVLKGPSASALYGSDAANGVVVITTKKGLPGQTHWSVAAMQGVSYIPGSYPTLTYAFGHLASSQSRINQCQAGTSAIANSSSAPCFIDSVRTFQALNDSRFSPLTTGPKSSVSATVSGGAQALTYSFTGSAQNTHGMTQLPSFAAAQYTDAVGSAPPTWMRHPDDYLGWNGSGQVQATLSPQASLTVSDMLSSSTQHRTSLGLTAVGDLINVYVDTANLDNTPAYTDFLTQITQATLMSTTNATLNWRIRPWLPLTVTGGYNRTQETDKQYLPSGLPLVILPTTGDTTGAYDLGTAQATVATLNANTTIPLSLWQSRTVQLALGTNFVSQSTAAQDINTTQVPVGVSDPTTFPQTMATSVMQQTQSAATYGWFVEPQLQLHSRLFVTPGIRLDGGTASGSGAGVTIFPKTNVSYIALDHTGENGGSRWSRAVSLLRLRGAFGIAGVQPTPGQALRLFSTPNIVTLDGGTAATTGTIITALGNTLLHPERSREVEAGFDAQFFQNRATLTATYYNKLRIDAIEPVSVAPSVFAAASLGIEQDAKTYANVGNIRNRGVEVTGDVRVLDGSAVMWSVNGSVSANSNLVLSTPTNNTKIEQLACTTAAASANGSFGPCVRAGYPLDAKFAPVVVGYADLNHDGVIERQEVFTGDSSVYIGSPDPRYMATFGTTLSLWHGRFSMAANGDYQNGMAVYCQVCSSLVISAANQRGADASTLATAAAYSVSITSNQYTVVNELRLDAVSLNLSLPTAVARTVRAQQATLSLQGSNLGLWTNYAGKDPLTTSAVSGLDAKDSGGLPLPRTWQLAVRITQ